MTMKLDDVALDSAFNAFIENDGDTVFSDLKAAITAYFTALEADGLARKGESLKSGWGDGVFLAMDAFPEGAKVERVPVTIIRERPNAKAPGN